MLLTNWQDLPYGQEKIEISNASTIVKILVMFLTNLLYIFVLLSPRLFPNRDFPF